MYFIRISNNTDVLWPNTNRQ